MRVRVLFFATLAQRVGAREIVLDLVDGATVAQVAAQLVNSHAALAPLRAKLAYAVNLEYVTETHVLHDQDELALIPPVSGG